MTAAIDPAGTLAATGLTNPAFVQTCGVMIMLANGFILTAMLWGGALAFLIDRQIKPAAVTLVACAALAFFGLIHSVLPTGGSYLPWHLSSALPYHWTVAYGASAILVVLLGRTGAFRESGSRVIVGAERAVEVVG
jgi:AGZA family xanthine/uracil permease-like MFS transporter